MNVQPQLILLQKTLLQIEGLGRQLYPQLDLWETAQPVLKEWAAERISGRALGRTVAPPVAGPRRSRACAAGRAAHGRAAEASEGKFRLRVESPATVDLRHEIRAAARRSDRVLVGAALLLGGIVWMAVHPAWWPGLLITLAGAAIVLLAPARVR